MAHKLLTPEEIIDDMVAFYSKDINRRATTTDKHGDYQCLYYMKEGRKVKMCAVGRCLKRGEAKNLSESCFWEESYESSGLEMKDFQPKYRFNNDRFWSKLQDLHDTDRYWDTKGLTAPGEDMVKIMKNTNWK